MKFQKIVIFFLLVISTNLSYGNSIPNKCPSATSIQAYGVNATGVIEWIIHANINQNQSYDTNNLWYFTMQHECGIFEECKEPSNLLSKASVALKTLKFVQGPVKVAGSWLCYYSVDDYYFTRIFAST